jgi:hypothetical protein
VQALNKAMKNLVFFNLKKIGLPLLSKYLDISHPQLIQISSYGRDLAEWFEQSWIRSQHPSTHWNLRGGR